jgi:aryl-alcohol dehydrogenase-like predicted oxidoreductase
LEFRKLGNLDVSTIGLGTLRTFDVTSETDIAVRREIVDNCLAVNINFIDSAAAYGNSEMVVGKTISGRRDRFYLATKVRCEGKEAGDAQIAQSFQSFQTDYIDLFQIHNMIDWQTHLPTLEALKAKGKIGMIGVTAMVHEAYPQIMDLMRQGRVDAVQIPYNVVERGCADELLPLAEELGTGILVMEPLKKGRYVNDLKSQPDVTPLVGFGIETWAQALLAWVLSDTRVTLAIPATSRPERIHENAAAASFPRLPQEMRDYVREETQRCL